MRKVVFLTTLIIVLVLPAFAVACKSEAPLAPSPQPPTGPTGELVILRENLGNEVWGIDVGSSYDAYIGLGPTCETLVVWAREYQEPAKVLPRLAERWEVSEDGLTWDFYLRKGIQWQDGWGEFTAEDVKFSMEMMGKPGSKNAKASLFRIGEGGQTESYTIINPYHIRIKLVQTDVLYPSYIAHTYRSIICKKYFEEVGYDEAIKHPIGTGPFKMIEHKPGEYVKFEAVENHWRKTPDFKYLTIKAIPENSARLAMAKTGKADMIPITPEFATEVEKFGWKVKNLPGGQNIWGILGGQILPTREKYDPTCPWAAHQDEPADSEWNQRALKVRKALNLAINKQAIIDKIYKGKAISLFAGEWGVASTSIRPEWESVPYDPGEAKRLLAEAGYPDGFGKPVTMYLLTIQWAPDNASIGEAMAMDWRAIGLDINTVPIDFANFRPKWSGRDSAWEVACFTAPAHPEAWVGNAFSRYSKSAFLFGHESLECDELLDKCKTALDPDERLQYTLELGDYLVNNYFDVPICNTQQLWALNPETVGEWPQGLNSEEAREFEYVTRAD